MIENNYNEKNKQIFKIEAKSKNEFFIGNTLNYSEYKGGVYIEETALSKELSYESFGKKLEEPFFNEADFVNRKKIYFFNYSKLLWSFMNLKKGFHCQIMKMII